MTWLDSHCHLDFLSQPDAALAQARKAGIGHWLIPGTEPGQWQLARKTFGQLNHVSLAFGHHPWFLPTSDTDLIDLEQSLNNGVVAVGEIGLDFYPSRTARPSFDVQERWFDAQLKLACEHDLPVIIHSVKAHHRIQHYLKRYPQARGVVHAFLGNHSQAMAFVEKGFLLGCGSLIAKSPKTLDAFSRIPLENILLETDAPDMRWPQPNADNPLLDLLRTADQLAAARNLDVAQLATVTSANSRRLFSIP
ncbi:MAG: TatD family hydrolase [Saccharospirillum sp.]|nr:TatD family hydrolase [Saccharospirillum sp.]